MDIDTTFFEINSEMNLSKLLFILIFSKILLINKLALNKTFFDF